MAYRKIEVLGTTYEYTVGRSNLKIKGIGVYDIEKVGQPRGDEKYSVGPGIVRDLILENRAG